MNPAKKPATLILGATLLWLAAHGSALADQIEAPVFSAGAVTTRNGSLLNVGQPFVGTVSGAQVTMQVGIVPLLVATATTLGPPVLAAPPHDILKNRYISLDPRGAGQTNPSAVYIRVAVDSTLVSNLIGTGPWWATDPVNGQSPSPATCISVLSRTKPAREPDWSGCPTLHLTGCPIVPTTTYAIAVEAGGILSSNALFDTQAKPGPKWHADCVGFFDGAKWTGPNGATNIDDAVAGIKTFQNPTSTVGCPAPPCNAAHLSVTDVHPNLNGDQINLIVNIGDVFSIILGFQGLEYPGSDLTQCP